MLSWETLTKNPKWILENAFTPPKREKELFHIIEHPDGRVEIKFEEEPPRFPVLKESISSKDFMSSRPSTSSIRHEPYPNPNKTNLVTVSSIRLDHKVPNLHYEEERSSSPTQTKMET